MDPNSAGGSAISDLMPLLLIVVGGVLATFGGFVSTWYQAKNARRIKLKEALAEQQLQIFIEAYRYVISLHFLVNECKLKKAMAFMDERSAWFEKNILLLPRSFARMWRDIGIQLRDVPEGDPGERFVLPLRELTIAAVRSIEQEFDLET